MENIYNKDMPNSLYLRNAFLATPFHLLVIVPFILLGNLLNLNFDFSIILLGALGWWIAMLLRLPVMLLIRNLPVQKGRNYVIAASGPAEEVVRLVILLVLGLTVNNAYSLAIGWAGVEIIYSLVQVFAMAVLKDRTDQKAQEAKELLKIQGLDKSFEDNAPFWSVLERLSASGLHLSFSLLLIISPWLVLLTAPLHSGFNFLVTHLAKKSIATSEVTLALSSCLLVIVSIYFTQ